MLKPISCCDLAQDGPDTAAAKGSSWIWQPPLTGSVNKVAAPKSSCRALPMSFLHPKKRYQGDQEFKEPRQVKHRSFHMLPKPLAPSLMVNEDTTKILKAGSTPKVFGWAKMICQLIQSRETQTTCLSLQRSPQGQLASPNHWCLWTAVRSSSASRNDRTFLLAEAPQKGQAYISWSKSELVWMPPLPYHRSCTGKLFRKRERKIH